MEPQDNDLHARINELQQLVKELEDIKSQMNSILLRQDVDINSFVYKERSRHYQEEKQILAREYVKSLLEVRFNHLSKELQVESTDKKIILIFDSGTTISPIMTYLAMLAKDQSRYWAKRRYLEIYTNNLVGAVLLQKFSEGRGLHQKTPFRCHVLGGSILTAYGATASEKTVKELLELKNSENHYIIVITTGNYILFNRESSHFMPIARTGAHPHVKSAMFDIADEVHMISPLGKILMDVYVSKNGNNLQDMVSTFNRDLNYPANTTEGTLEQYKLVSPDLIQSFFQKDGAKFQFDPTEYQLGDMNAWFKKIILITTSRTREADLLKEHYQLLQDKITRFSGKFAHNGPYLWDTDFTGLPRTRNLQLDIEIPHDNLRNEELRQRYFYGVR